MVEKVNPSPNRPADAFTTAGAIGYGGGVGGSGYVVPSDSPTDLSKQDSNITESTLSAFSESHSATSYSISINGGEAFVFGSWVVIDDSPARTITLASDTPDQTVYLGWDKGSSNNVIIGLPSDFDNFSNNTDQRIPLYEFDTDTSGVASVRDKRLITQPDVLTHSTEINKNYQIPEGKGAVFSGPITGSGSVTGNGQISVIQEGTTFTDNVDAQGNDINNIGSLEASTVNIQNTIGDYRLSTLFSVDSGVQTQIIFDDIKRQDNNILDLDTSTGTVTAQESGLFLVICRISTQDLTEGDEIRLFPQKNGSRSDENWTAANAVFGNQISTTYVVSMNQNDKLSIEYYQGSGTTIDIRSEEDDTKLSVVKIA